MNQSSAFRMQQLSNSLKIAWRRILQNSTYSIINILGLTIGITGAIVIFYCLKHETNFDQYHTLVENTYRVVQHDHTASGTQFWNTTAYPLPAALRSDFPNLKVTQTAGPFSRIISVQNSLGETLRDQEEHVLFTDQYYLQIFDFKGWQPDFWLAGNSTTAFDQPNSVIITADLVVKYFPEIGVNLNSVIGKTLLLNNKDPLVVTGVVRNPPSNTNLPFDLLIPYAHYQKDHPYQTQNWSGNYSGTTYLTLEGGIEPQELEAEIALWKAKYLKPEDYRRIEYRLQPISDIHTNKLYGNSNGSYVISMDLLWGLGILGLFLIIIAGVNYVNLALAQITRRNVEVGVRKVLGSTKKQLIRNFISEILIFVVVAALFSVFLADIILNQISTRITLFDLNLQLDWQVLPLLSTLVILIVFLAGWYPAHFATVGSPLQSLQNKDNGFGKKGLALRKSLVGLQFGISHALILCTIIVASQMHYVKNKDLGFYQDTILTINIPDQDSLQLQNFAQRLKRDPNIQAISFASGIPLTHLDEAYGTDFRLPQEPASQVRAAEMKVVDRHYKEVYGLELLAGSWLNRSNERSRFNAFIANEAAIESLGLVPEEAIGQSLVINEGTAPIIGVVRNFHNNPLQQAVQPCFLFYYGTGFFNEASIKLGPTIGRNKSVAETLQYIEKVWKSTFPEDVYKYVFLDEKIAQNYAIEHLLFKVMRTVALLAIFVGCIGLYGMVAFISETRTKEIGIRKVLGASVGTIITLLGKDFIKPVAIALMFSAPVALYLMQKWLQNFVYHAPIEWWSIVGAALIAFLLAATTIGWQGSKAAMMNPVDSLRNE